MWNAETDWLMRLISLLFSLADAAEFAACKSGRVRHHVLSTLQPAEQAAFRAVADAAHHYGAPIPPNAMMALADWANAGHGESRDDALRLADRFRALALALSYIAAWADYFARRLCAVAHTRSCFRQFSSAVPAAGHDGPAAPWPDTS